MTDATFINCTKALFAWYRAGERRVFPGACIQHAQALLAARCAAMAIEARAIAAKGGK